jgi:hypothetical protein
MYIKGVKAYIGLHNKQYIMLYTIIYFPEIHTHYQNATYVSNNGIATYIIKPKTLNSDRIQSSDRELDAMTSLPCRQDRPSNQKRNMASIGDKMRK